MNPMRTRRLVTIQTPLAALLATFSFATAARADGGWFPPDTTQGPQAPQAPQAPADDAQGPEDADQAPAPPSDDYADTDPSALNDFRAPLAPYGTWTDDPTYGTVWVPDAAQVGQDFAPYQTAGQWGVNAGGDWLWQSNYVWGYIPFHYGRWVWTGANWGWVAGRRYSPAWVSWRVGEGGYVGWAPTPPGWGWRGGRAQNLGFAPRAAFCFAPVNMAFFPGVSNYVVRDRGMVASIAASTHPYHAPTSGYGAGRSSPTLSQAHIPASASPRVTARADGRALAYSTRSSTAAVRAGRTLNEGGSIYRGPRGLAQSPGLRSYSATGVRSSAASYPSVSHAGGGGSRSFPSGPHYSAPAVAPPPVYRPPSVSGAAVHSSGGHAGGGGRRR